MPERVTSHSTDIEAPKGSPSSSSVLSQNLWLSPHCAGTLFFPADSPNGNAKYDSCAQFFLPPMGPFFQFYLGSPSIDTVQRHSHGLNVARYCFQEDIFFK
jgi:hypothetical protein